MKAALSKKVILFNSTKKKTQKTPSTTINCLKTCQSLVDNACALKLWAVVLIWTIKFESGLCDFLSHFIPVIKLHTLFLISKNTYLMLNYQDNTVAEYWLMKKKKKL